MLQTHHLTPSILFSHRFNFHLFSIPVYVGKPPSYLHTSPLTVSHRSRVGGCWSTSLAAALNKEGWEMVEGSWAWNFPQNLKVPKSPLKKWWQHQKISWNKHGRCQVSRAWTFFFSFLWVFLFGRDTKQKKRHLESSKSELSSNHSGVSSWLFSKGFLPK